MGFCVFYQQQKYILRGLHMIRFFRSALILSLVVSLGGEVSAMKGRKSAPKSFRVTTNEKRDLAPVRQRSAPGSKHSSPRTPDQNISPRNDLIDQCSSSPRVNICWILGANHIPVCVEYIDGTSDIFHHPQLKRHHIQKFVALVDADDALCVPEHENIIPVQIACSEDCLLETIAKFCEILKEYSNQRVAIYVSGSERAAYIMLVCWAIFMAINLEKDELSCVDHSADIDQMADNFVQEGYEHIAYANPYYSKYKNGNTMDLSQDLQALIADFARSCLKTTFSDSMQYCSQ